MNSPVLAPPLLLELLEEAQCAYVGNLLPPYGSRFVAAPNSWPWIPFIWQPQSSLFSAIIGVGFCLNEFTTDPYPPLPFIQPDKGSQFQMNIYATLCENRPGQQIYLKIKSLVQRCVVMLLFSTFRAIWIRFSIFMSAGILIWENGGLVMISGSVGCIQEDGINKAGIVTAFYMFWSLLLSCLADLFTWFAHRWFYRVHPP